MSIHISLLSPTPRDSLSAENCGGESEMTWAAVNVEGITATSFSYCGGACPTAFIFGVLVSFRRVPLQQRREYHVAIKAQDIRAGPQRIL
jgi:hypothetical protein